LRSGYPSALLAVSFRGFASASLSAACFEPERLAMSLKAEIIRIIHEEVPGCIAAHERDGHDKLHDVDIEFLASAIVKHVRRAQKKKKKEKKKK
jgi:hypothetical protein